MMEKCQQEPLKLRKEQQTKPSIINIYVSPVKGIISYRLGVPFKRSTTCLLSATAN